jgi:hypothetical protein
MRPFVCSLLLAVLLPQPAACSSDALRRLLLPFYSAQIPLSYDEQFPHWRQSSWDEKGMKNAYKNLTQANPSPLLLSLAEARLTYRLNDWLYFELLSTAIDRILANHTPNEKELALWFFLKESGFHTRMASSGNELYVYAHTEEEVFEVPLVTDEGATFVNLTAIRQRNPESDKSVYLLALPEHPAGRPFSFQLKELPLLPAKVTTREFQFRFEDQPHHLRIQLDQTVVQWMQHYPLIQEGAYFDIPFSPALRASLIPQLKALTRNKPPLEVLGLLTAFSRTAFRYQEDIQSFGRSKPMIAEEVLYYPFSDCEDRAALLYALIREFLIVPTIVIAYPNHMTLAVDLPNLGGEFVVHKGRRYFICDPTGSIDASLLGEPLKWWQTQAFQLIREYK